MALLGFWGFDEGTMPEVGWVFSSVSSITGRNGGKAIAAHGNSGTNSITYTMSTASTTVIIGAPFELNTNPVSNWLQLKGDNGTTTHLTLSTDSLGHIVLSCGATVLGTSTDTISPSVWRSIDIQATIDDVAGSCTVRLDGQTIISFSGDTKNAGTNSSIDTFAFVGGTSAGPNIDCCYLCDTSGSAPYNTFLGDFKVETVVPTGNGASDQFVGSDGDSLNNYLLVDESTPNTTDYVGSSTSGNQDLYAMGALATTSGTVLAVQPQAYVAKSDAGTVSGELLVRASSGTIATDALPALSTTYQLQPGAIHTTDPDGAVWTIASVNAAQMGVQVV